MIAVSRANKQEEQASCSSWVVIRSTILEVHQDEVGRQRPGCLVEGVGATAAVNQAGQDCGGVVERERIVAVAENDISHIGLSAFQGEGVIAVVRRDQIVIGANVYVPGVASRDGTGSAFVL